MAERHATQNWALDTYFLEKCQGWKRTDSIYLYENQNYRKHNHHHELDTFLTFEDFSDVIGNNISKCDFLNVIELCQHLEDLCE